MSGLLDNVVEKTRRRLLASSGKVYDAFDGLGCGLSGRQLADWYHDLNRAALGDKTGRAFGQALTVAMMAVEAERRTRREQADEPPSEEWARDPEWEAAAARMNPDWPSDVPTPEGWVKSPLQALVGREALADDDEPRWHISVAHADRIPTWAELVDAAHFLRPGVVFCIGLPPRSWWLNYDEPLNELLVADLEQVQHPWRESARGDRPT